MKIFKKIGAGVLCGLLLISGIAFAETRVDGGLVETFKRITVNGTITLLNGAALSNAVNNTVTLTENGDILSWVFDGSDVYQKWSDGSLTLQTDEGTNTRTDINIRGKGTGAALVALYDGSSANYWMSIDQTDAIAGIDFGTAVTAFNINDAQNATLDTTIKTKNSATAFVVNSDATAGNEYVSTTLPMAIGKTAPSGSGTSLTALEIAGSKAANARYGLSLYDTTAAGLGVGGGIFFYGNYTGTTPTYGASIDMQKSTATAGEYGFDLVMSTRPNGGVGTERMRIDSAGQIQSAYMARNYQHDEIGILLDNLTAPKAIVGFTGTGATTTTESGYESGAGRVWTYSGGLATDKIFQGSTYVYSFDGTDSYLSTPDTADMSFGDGSTDSAFSVGGWVQVVDSATFQWIMGKDDATNREWSLLLDSGERLLFGLYDISVTPDATPIRTSDSALSVGWHFIVVTYSAATGGATAANDITIYVDGAVVASTATNDANYVAMENTTALTYIGERGDGSYYFAGDMGRLFVTAEALSAADVWKLYEQTRGHYNK